MSKYNIIAKLFNRHRNFFNKLQFPNPGLQFRLKKILNMSNGENGSSLNEEHIPLKKMKLESDINKAVLENLKDVPLKNWESDLSDTVVEKRTVSTMCGAWRPEEVDGGHIFVLEKRDPGMSPDPMREEDFPENIEDFWEASFANIDIDQVIQYYIY